MVLKEFGVEKIKLNSGYFDIFAEGFQDVLGLELEFEEVSPNLEEKQG